MRSEGTALVNGLAVSKNLWQKSNRGKVLKYRDAPAVGFLGVSFKISSPRGLAQSYRAHSPDYSFMENRQMPDMDIPAQLRTWAKEIREQRARNRASYETGAEDADLLETAASEIERLRKQLAREGS